MTYYYKGYPQNDTEKPLKMVNVDELEHEAKYVIPEPAYYYIASGSENEWTWRNNINAFNHFQIVPRALTNTSDPKTNTNFLGMDLKMPLMISPIAAHGIAHKEAELDTARGAKMAGALFSSSTYANMSVEDIAKVAGDAPRVFQLYMSRDWDFNEMVLKAVKETGYKAILLTIDALVSGHREANIRTHFTYPVPMAFFTRYLQGKGEGKGQSVAQMYRMSAQKIGPKDVAKIKEISGLPVFVKGIMCAEDAYIAMGAGADGIVVSNHGGREIDGAPATIDVLPEIAKEVNKRVPIILDSGVRRGSHVFKALALGADLVGIGRPFLYGLALGGAQGVESVLKQLNDELKIDMELTGCKTIEDVKHAKIDHFRYTSDTGVSSTSPQVIKPYPVTPENTMKDEQLKADAETGASN